MGDVSKGEGRTVLFVSHNMTAVETLCSKAITLKQGLIQEIGSPELLIKNYLANNISNNRTINFNEIENALGNEFIKISYASVDNTSTEDPSEFIDVSSDFKLVFEIINQSNYDELSIGFDLKNTRGDTIFGSAQIFSFEKNRKIKVACNIPKNLLNDDTYQIMLYVHTTAMSLLFIQDELLTFEIKDKQRENGYLGKINGFIRPELYWNKI